MFLIIAKVAFFFLRPSNVILFLVLGGAVLLLVKWRRTGTTLVVVGALLMLACGLGPVGNMLFVPLESRFPRVTEVVTPPTGIVVLGGAVDTVRTERHGQVALAESAERVTAAAALARRFPEARIVLSGGQVAIFPGTVQEADAMVTLMASLGVHSRRPVLEDRSQNTWQNAVYSLDLAKPQPGERWLLVTSAFHMPRAIGVFRKAGWTGITAYPVDYRSTSDHLGFTSVSRGLRFTDIAVREWIGLVAYYLTGRTDSLLPGPDGVRK
ncbi:uncharacterized SAM-binding protein YcdF (DUF218 family) [Rhodobium orientis]|uniref:DUF218 domain-containing protein n=1 Tax=Rhodobium orientis TaxID=34017 RepID=A0A327JHY6_9HYPH|nr:YdcF family protein [Rhodobium orientis]MBB4301547.1 uncharacterized SAM-binding protein YcdF (DUF218 family) [Rhodobium orientis]MBK5952243.1 hypothetical protein [Rhodobium orientis]RAI24934.1 hypothetical protein CH339_20355 [Rhodobium orientis]